MRTALCTLILLTGASVWAAADPEAVIRNAEQSWAKEVVQRDYAGLEKLLGDQLIYAHATGAVESKDEYIGRLRSGAQKYNKVEHEKIRVVVYGDSAVTHSAVRMTGTSNGKPFNDHVMMLNVWEKQAGSWRLAAHQTTKIEP